MCRSVGSAYKKIPPCLPLTIFVDSPIQVFSYFLVHPILVYPIEHVVGAYKADIQEVSSSHLESGVSSLDAGRMAEAWLRRPRCILGVSAVRMARC